jgi:hypothetical protein
MARLSVNCAPAQRKFCADADRHQPLGMCEMTDKKDLIFKLEFPGSDGKPIPVQFGVEALRNLITQILHTLASVPQPPMLEFAAPADRHPIKAIGLGIAPLAGDETAARVSIVIGPTDLQFAIPLFDLMQALEHLKSLTEPDLTSSHRPN